jgi:hypothetical protein
MNPLDILYAWQSALLAVVIVGITQGVKAGIEAYLLIKNAGTTKTGRELRKEISVLDRAILPLVPLVSGALIGAFVPMRPEVLVQYVNEHGGGSRLAFAMWGAAIGQFSDYLYQRFKRMLPAQSATPSTPPATPSEAPPASENDTGRETIPPASIDAPRRD